MARPAGSTICVMRRTKRPLARVIVSVLPLRSVIETERGGEKALDALVAMVIC